MINKGFITIHRQIMKTGFYGDSYTLHLAIHCLLKANWEDKDIVFNGKLLKIPRGSFISGRKILSKETNIPPSTIRRRLKILEKMRFLDIKKTNKYSMISILKYDHYQKVDIRWTSGGHQVDTTNNTNNINNTIVGHLNSLLDTSYKPSTGKTRELIQARLNEGFTADDFKTVHKKMVKAWGKDEKMRQFLRPQTLYSNKFESYLNRKEEAPKPHEHRKKNDERYKKTMARLDKEKKERLREISKTIGK